MRSSVQSVMRYVRTQLFFPVLKDERAAVSLIYALVLVSMLGALGGGMDIANALQSKYRLDLAADAAAISCGEVWEANMQTNANPQTTLTLAQFNSVEAASNTLAQTRGTNNFMAQAGSLASVLAGGFPKVTATDSVSTTTAGAAVTCTATYQANNPVYLLEILGFRSITIKGNAASTVNLAPFTQVFLVLDTSTSMMVGSTPTDQGLIASWVAANDTGNPFLGTNPKPCRVFGPNTSGGVQAPTGASKASGCDNLPLTSAKIQAGRTAGHPVDHDIMPCAFACHDTGNGNALTAGDMEQGLQVAALQGATTRFDVVRLALVNDPTTQAFCVGPSSTSTTTSTLGALLPPLQSGINPVPSAVHGAVPCKTTGPLSTEGLLSYIRDTYQASNARANLKTFTYNMYGFNYGIGGDEPPAGEFQANNGQAFDQVTNIDYSQYSVTGATMVDQVATGVNQLAIGIDTHLNPPVNSSHKSVMEKLVTTIVGPTKSGSVPGTTSDNPLKFVIILTDGLSSDRNWNYGDFPGDIDPIPGGTTQTSTSTTTFCADWPGPAPLVDGTLSWGGGGAECNNAAYVPGFTTTPAAPAPAFQLPVNPTRYFYASPLGFNPPGSTVASGQNLCAALKADGLSSNGNIPGVTVAILETPYVPLTGQDPVYFPYEGSVQQVIYPSGNPATTGTKSAVSTALLNCATSPEFYFQATDDTAITNGFITLFNNFVGQYVHLTS